MSVEAAVTVQAIAAVLLMLITAYYVKLTHSLVHASHMTKLRPVSIRAGVLHVNNLGPAVVDVHIEVFNLDGRGATSGHVDHCGVQGPYSIANLGGGNYRLSPRFLVGSDLGVRMRWKTLSANPQSTYWNCTWPGEELNSLECEEAIEPVLIRSKALDPEEKAWVKVTA